MIIDANSECRAKVHYAECRYAECRYAKCRGAACTHEPTEDSTEKVNRPNNWGKYNGISFDFLVSKV
jgi:hypothetical protein